MNGSKTCFITLESSHDNLHPSKLKIRVDDVTLITEDECVKILGFYQNRRNNMDTQLNAISAKTGLLMSKLRPALPYLDEHTRKLLINSKVKSVALYGLNLMIGQP